jgi:purine nucleosidase
MPITLVSLDATTKAVLRGPDLKALTQGGGGGHSELASFIKRAVGYYVEFHRKFRGVRGCYVHDALAVALAIDEGIGSFKELSLGVDLARERGALFVRRGGRPNVRFCRGVDSERFFRLFMKGMRRAILKSRGER